MQKVFEIPSFLMLSVIKEKKKNKKTYKMPNWQQVSSAAINKSTVQLKKICQEKVSLKKKSNGSGLGKKIVITHSSLKHF